MTKAHNRTCVRIAAAAIGALFVQLAFPASAQGTESRQQWQSVIVSSVGEGWSIDQVLAEATFLKGKFSATLRQSNPRTQAIYDYIVITGRFSIDKSLPRLKGVSGYAIAAVAQYKNSDRSPFKILGTYRKVTAADGSYDEVVVLHEDYNVITMSRRSHSKQ